MKEFRDLTREELKALYSNYSVYRDHICAGWAKLSPQEFYKKFVIENQPQLRSQHA